MIKRKTPFHPLPLPERRGGSRAHAISLPSAIVRLWLLFALFAGILSLEPVLSPTGPQLPSLPAISTAARSELIDFRAITEIASYPVGEAILFEEAAIRPEPWVALLPAIGATIQGATQAAIAAKLSPSRGRTSRNHHLARLGDLGTYRAETWASELPLDPVGEGIGVTITAYSSEEEQTDSDPYITATGTATRPGVIALSRDLIETFTPGAPFRFGETVYLPGFGVFHVEDTMSPRFARRVDIWFPSSGAAIEFGRRRGQLFTSAGRATGYGPEAIKAFASDQEEAALSNAAEGASGAAVSPTANPEQVVPATSGS